LVTIDRDTATRLALADPEFAAALDDYQQEVSCRALQYDIAEPSLAETPELTLRLLADQVARGYDPAAEAVALGQRREAARERARAALAQHSPADRERFERALVRAQRAYPVREDNEFLTASVPLALVRYRVLEIGRRLVERTQLNRSTDVFFLTWEEARSALLNVDDRRALATRRRGELAYIEQHPGPASYGKVPGLPPSFDALPAESRLMMKALVWYMDRVLEAAPSNREQQGDGQVLTGIPASPGRYTGRVRVIKDESEFDQLQPGEVLVCPITSPVWSVLFPSVGALVTDTGGVLSHPCDHCPRISGAGGRCNWQCNQASPERPAGHGRRQQWRDRPPAVSIATSEPLHLADEPLEYFSEAVAATAALRAAAHLGVLVRLDAGAATAHELATACGIEERGAERLLNALAGLGLLESHGDRWLSLQPDLSGLGRTAAMWDHLDGALRGRSTDGID
jgi:hypothetical protein